MTTQNKSPFSTATYLSDEEPDALGKTVLVTNFPAEGRKIRIPSDLMPWGQTAEEWVKDAIGGGVPKWLEHGLKCCPQAAEFIQDKALGMTHEHGL